MPVTHNSDRRDDETIATYERVFTKMFLAAPVRELWSPPMVMLDILLAEAGCQWQLSFTNEKLCELDPRSFVNMGPVVKFAKLFVRECHLSLTSRLR